MVTQWGAAARGVLEWASSGQWEEAGSFRFGCGLDAPKVKTHGRPNLSVFEEAGLWIQPELVVPAVAMHFGSCTCTAWRWEEAQVVMPATEDVKARAGA